MKIRRVWMDGPEPGVFIADVDPPLQQGEVEIPIEDDQPAEVAVARTSTPKIDGDALIRVLEIERLVATRARRR